MLVRSLIGAAFLILPLASHAQDDVATVGGNTSKDLFKIIVQRDSVRNGTVYGTISVNNKVLGTTYENPAKMIAPNTYVGAMRYYSPTAKSGGHVQGPAGAIGRAGDFLLEVVDATADDDGRPKTNILFHGGVKPSDSEGCIMLGAVSRNTAGARYLKDSDPLRQLRLMFYGDDNPVQSPAKDIKIEVRAAPESGTSVMP